jgi:glucuronate isomerase
MPKPLALHPDRLLPADPSVRTIARRLLAEVDGVPILSPHGHVDPSLLVDDERFPDPATLLITPDHYVTRLLHANGVPLPRLGLTATDGSMPTSSPREVWRSLCAHWRAFRGTPSRYWLEYELAELFGVALQPSAGTADEIYDHVSDRLAAAEYRPRALFKRFGIELLATTDDPCSPLAEHRRLAEDETFTGTVIPTFRPDVYLDPQGSQWRAHLRRLAATTDCDTENYAGFLAALRARREAFRARGATSTDHSPPDAGCEPLDDSTAARIHRAAVGGTATTAEACAYRRHMLFQMAAMSAEDGLVMQLHPGVYRSHHEPTARLFGPDTGHDIPVTVEFVRALRPILDRFGTHPGFRMVLFTLDESTFSRELAPLAGFYPAVYLGAPWWFLDTPAAISRFRYAVTDTVGFYRTAGFVDDTRAFCSIPARHDMSRRADASFLAELVASHRLTEDEAAATLRDLVSEIPRTAFRLPKPAGR